MRTPLTPPPPKYHLLPLRLWYNIIFTSDVDCKVMRLTWMTPDAWCEITAFILTVLTNSSRLDDEVQLCTKADRLESNAKFWICAKNGEYPGM